MKIVLREKIYIPIRSVDHLDRYKDELDSRYVIDVFNEDGCKDCEYLPDRPTDTCSDCANYLDRTKLYKVVERPNGNVFVGLPYGHRSMIPKIFPFAPDLEQLVMTPDFPFRTKLRFTGTLKESQEEAVSALEPLFEGGALRGLLRAPARSGKTVLSVALIIRIGQRALILTHLEDLCKQFYETCMGGPNQGALTNAPKLHDRGEISVVWAKKRSDYFKGDIVISTYQKFISESGREFLKEIEEHFGLLVVDEVHRAAAPSFLKVIASLNTHGKLGLTATVSRKDSMHVLNEYVFGPVLHSIASEVLRPSIVFHETGLFPKKSYANWQYYQRWLERSDSRTDMIVDQVIADVKAGRSVVIPCTFTSQIHELVRKINWVMGRKIAEAVVGGATTKSARAARENALDRAREGRTKVIVGTRSIIATGINVPLWDTLFWICPLSNPSGWVQEYSRILTPLEGKRPLIRMFLDGSDQTRGCLRSCLFKTEGKNKTLARFAAISTEEWAVANAYLKDGKMQEVVRNKPKVKKLANGRVSIG